MVASHGILMNSYLGHILFFTVLQAGLSAILSVILAVPLARALARQKDFLFRKFLLLLFALPIMIPTIAVLSGMIAIYGKNGIIAQFLSEVGMTWPSFYGLAAILLTHVFLNLPLAVRFYLAAYEQIPLETWRLAANLNFSSRQYWKHIDAPVLGRELPLAAGLIFLFCLTSFSIVLTLGGGPAATTLEVAIFQALRFDFDPELALKLGFLQALLASFALFMVHIFRRSLPQSMALRPQWRRWDGMDTKARWLDGATIFLSVIFIGAPFLAITFNGILGLAMFKQSAFALPMLRSAVFSLSGGVISVFLAWVISAFSYRRTFFLPKALLALFAYGSLIFSPLLLTSLILIMSAGQEFSLGAFWMVIIGLNVFLGLPYALYGFQSAYRHMREQSDRLCASLALKGWRRFHLIEMRLLWRPAKRAGLYAALAILGDLGIVAMLGDRRALTLPWLLYDQLGAHRLEAAASASFLLLMMALIFAALSETKDAV